MKKTYDRTYYVYADDALKCTCKTKETAQKRAIALLDTMLYSDVRIDRMTIVGLK